MNENANIPQIRVSLRYRNKALIYSVMSQMRGLLPLILILALPFAGIAQFGANVRYQFGQSRTLDEVNLSQDGLQAAVEYHFRLKQRRLEFRPALGYRFTWNQAEKEGFLYAFDFDFNTAIYPFDFASDCHCPTFSKEGELIKKGFFLELQPGIAMQSLKRTKIGPGDGVPPPVAHDLVFKLGAAAGLDIGLSDTYTFTPMFSVTMLTPNDWKGLNPDGSSGRLDDYVLLGAGFRVTYKSDDHRR